MKIVAQTVTLAILSSFGTLLHAQKIGIQLIDGKHGHPMAFSHVNVWVGNDRKAALAIPTDATGTAWLSLTDQDNKVNVGNADRKAPVDPVVRYSAFLRINVPYVLCQSPTPPYSWLTSTGFFTKEVFQQGIVRPNSCGKAAAFKVPGKIIFFVRPLNFWEMLSE